MASTIEMLAEHIASEELASRTYRYFQSWCGLNGWPGSEAYFMAESADELKHMQGFQSYVDDIFPPGSPPPIGKQAEIDAPPLRLIDCFSAALELEKKVMRELNAIGAQAVKEGDFDTLRFLQPYTQIGVESIRELTTFVQQLRLAGSDAAALLAFDHEIGED